MKVLVIRFSSIGDIVLTTPVVRCLKLQHPLAEIHYLTRKSYGSLLENNPYISRLHYLEDDLGAVIEDLKKEKFDYLIDLHHNIRTLRVKKALGLLSFSFHKLNIEKWILTNFKIDILPDKSIVDRYFDAIKPLFVVNDGNGLDYFLPPQQKIGNSDIPMSHWGGYVGCVIGGSFTTKKLPVEQWKAFCEKVPYPVMLLGGPEDSEMGNEIAIQNKVKIYNSCGKFNINESAELVKLSRVVVSNDTGLMHVAAAFQKPVISLWGNTSPEMGMFPYYGNNNLRTHPALQSVIIEKRDLECRPCSKLGHKQCPRGHFKCMNDLDMNQVSEAVVRLWDRKQTDPAGSR